MGKHSRILGIILAITLLVLPVQMTVSAADKQSDYGVFVGATKPDYKRMGKYHTIVIDAEYFSAKQIKKLKKAGCKEIYSYLNVGSLEDFRDYDKEFEHIKLGAYENWSEESWVDVSDVKWQKFCVSRAKKLKKKGVDGFFIDNCDVYYNYPKERIYKGLVTILSGINKTGGKVIINGGDRFVKRSIQEKKTAFFDGVNQECVYTTIDFEKNKFKKAKIEERKYFTNYLKKVQKAKKKVYVLEYTKDKKLKQKARKYTTEHGWILYTSGKLNLT